MRLSLFVSFGLFALLGGCASPTDSTFAGGPFPSTSVGTGGVTTATTTGGGIFGTYDEPVVVANPPPPAVSGGTLLIIAQGHRAAVADPERDHVVIVFTSCSAAREPWPRSIRRRVRSSGDSWFVATRAASPTMRLPTTCSLPASEASS